MRGVVLLLVCLLFASCSWGSASPRKPLVIASFYPLYAFTRRIGGDRVEVRQLLRSGAEPHDYEPTPQDLTTLRRAAVLVYNGAGLEPWIPRIRSELPRNVVLVDATAGLPVVRVWQGERTVDPHVWLDPVLAQQQVGRIEAGLVRADPAGEQTYRRNAQHLRAELGGLHERFRRRLARCRTRLFITAHAAFGYLARRYGLVMVSVAGLSPEAEPSAARLREVIELVRRHRVRVIYAESAAGSRIVEAVARETGARVTVLNPLERLGPEEERRGRTYFTVMDENLRSLADGLECR